MSEALVCLAETFYPQELCKEQRLHFPNNSTDGEDGVAAKGMLPRKREASHGLMENVKRREGSRTPHVPCCIPSSTPSPLFCDTMCCSAQSASATAALNAEFSDSSVTDSGIESSKNSSPSHSINTLSPCHLEEDMCQSFMDVDAASPSGSPKECEAEKCEPQKSVANCAAEDFNCLHLSDTSTASTPVVLPSEEDICPKEIKSPVIHSLFQNVPPLIYFPTKDEVVGALPESVRPSLKWKLSTITPVVIRQIVLRTGFALLEADTTEDWVGTWGKHLKCGAFKKIKDFQKVNHYPGGFHLGRKDRLWENYRKMTAKYGAEEFNFFPETYILPADLKTLKEAWGKNEKRWIIKPCASARGCGVKVIYKWSQVPKNTPFVIQRYISDPYLIDGNKFDLRLYAMVSSIEPLKIYVYEDGLVRFASEKYSLANKSFSNRFIHLTNYSINKKSSTYATNDDENMCQGHKWSLKAFWAYMSNSGIDVVKIQAQIIDMIVKTIISTEGPICRMLKTYAKSSYNCFELFGFDVMLDKDLHPWLLEVNISPSLHTKSVLDGNVKGPMVRDMLNIAGFEIPERFGLSSIENPSTWRHKPLHNRWLSQEERRKHSIYTYLHSDPESISSSILSDLTTDDLLHLMESEDELQRRGAFTRVFPTQSTSRYFDYFDHVRYYNVLLDAWEKAYHDRREKGIELLKRASETLHLKKNVASSVKLDENLADSTSTLQNAS